MIETLKRKIQWLSTHNKNYTKQQYYIILDCLEIIEAMEEGEWEKDYNKNYPYEVRLIDTTEETIIDTWRYASKHNATEMVKTLKKKYKDKQNLQVELEIIGA